MFRRPPCLFLYQFPGDIRESSCSPEKPMEVFDNMLLYHDENPKRKHSGTFRNAKKSTNGLLGIFLR